MPLYEYKCDKCGATFEVIQKVAEPPVKKCPQCGGSVKKIISPPALQFKGSGFYITDYAKKEKPSESKPKGKTTKAATPEPPAADKKPDKETTSTAK